MPSPVPLPAALAEAAARRNALLTWTVEGWDETRAIAQIVTQLEMPAVLSVSPEAVEDRPVAVWGAMLSALADEVDGLLVAHLDGVSSVAALEEAADAGFSSVGVVPALPDFGSYFDTLAEIAAAARARGVSVEAEAFIPVGDREKGRFLSHPPLAIDMVRTVEVDALALSITDGTHPISGHSVVDWSVIEAISPRVGVPLTLRPGSYLAAEDRLRLGREFGVRAIDVSVAQRAEFSRLIRIAVARSHQSPGRRELMSELRQGLSDWALRMVMETWRR